MTAQNLLVELLVEELPPKALKKLGDAFATQIWLSLADQGLVDISRTFEVGSTHVPYASPRRLAVWIKDVEAKAPDRSISQKLMPVSVGLDASGQPTPALLKRLGALGADASAVAGLKRASDGKAEALFYDSVAPGAELAAGLQRALDEAIAKLPIPKVMSYQLETDCELPGWSSVNFVRPAHGLVALHGTQVVPVKTLGLTARNITLGHRFLSSGEITINSGDTYAQQLRNEGKVIASFAERRLSIESQLGSLKISPESDDVIRPDALLDEVTALVEWPAVYECHFEKAFLEVPEECLVLTMQTNQKYFPCTLAGALVNRFLVVSNIETEDPSAIVGGNERVVRPRLADAKFFFDQDRKKPLKDRVEGLGKVVYHNKLGTQGDRVDRVKAIARAIGQRLGGAALAASAERAALLAKTDLLTEMVGEFPELQGTMGWYYARHDKESDDVALAIADHYRPRFAGDELPRNMTGVVVALADKLETLVGMFGIGNLPTGDKDPFALRRHALGVVRMLMEKDLPLELVQLIHASFSCFFLLGSSQEDQLLFLAGRHESNSNMYRAFDGKEQERADLLVHFIYDRLAGSLREQGYTSQEVDSVLALKPQRLGDISKRLAAVHAFAALPEAPALAAANKRIGNILKKSDTEPADEVLIDLFREPAEEVFRSALAEAAVKANPAYEKGDYTASLLAWAELKAPVDAFFDEVMVNDDDLAVRRNRLGLLRDLHNAMNRVADLSRLAT